MIDIRRPDTIQASFGQSGSGGTEYTAGDDITIDNNIISTIYGGSCKWEEGIIIFAEEASYMSNLKWEAAGQLDTIPTLIDGENYFITIDVVGGSKEGRYTLTATCDTSDSNKCFRLFSLGTGWRELVIGRDCWDNAGIHYDWFVSNTTYWGDALAVKATITQDGYIYTPIDAHYIPVSGKNDGTNWTSITIDEDTYAIPQGSFVRYDTAQTPDDEAFNQVMSNLDLGAERDSGIPILKNSVADDFFGDFAIAHDVDLSALRPYMEGQYFTLNISCEGRDNNFDVELQVKPSYFAEYMCSFDLYDFELPNIRLRGLRLRPMLNEWELSLMDWDFDFEDIVTLSVTFGDGSTTYVPIKNELLGDRLIDATESDGLLEITKSDGTTVIYSGGVPDEYIKSASVDDNTLTLVDQDNNTIEFTPEGGGTEYTAGDGISIENYEISVDDTIARAEDIPSLEGYATEDYVNVQIENVEGEIPSLDGYATEDYVDNAIANNLNEETWTFTLDDDTTVTKKVWCH